MNRLLRCLLDESTATAGKIVDAMPEAMWRDQPEGRFGPGEQVVHMSQSELFALQLILPAGGIGPGFVLQPPFTRIVEIPDLAERHRALSQLNLEGARRGLTRFNSLAELQQWWQRKRDEAVQALEQIPDVERIWWTEIQHPLVPTLRRPLIVMTAILFTAHPWYHAGQTAIEMKVRDWAAAVPFPFGEFSAVMV
ncbi:MAG: hypothetical protein HYY50_00105 [Candidatus Kerfeldbacteria bacterium]|nr:hypothetical protein [Candidatus Kerfeldbacteria bacterium]